MSSNFWHLYGMKGCLASERKDQYDKCCRYSSWAWCSHCIAFSTWRFQSLALPKDLKPLSANSSANQLRIYSSSVSYFWNLNNSYLIISTLIYITFEFTVLIVLESQNVEDAVIEGLGSDSMVTKLHKSQKQQRGSLPSYVEIAIIVYVFGLPTPFFQSMSVHGGPAEMIEL